MNNQAAQTMPELAADDPIIQMRMVVQTARANDALISRTWVSGWADQWEAERVAALSQPGGVLEPDTALLVSMATCLNHGFGLLGTTRQQSMLRDMRKLWDEVMGRGYYRPERADFYMGMIKPVRADALAAAPAASGGECQTCGGRGEIGGHVGQTAETFDYVTEPCPDCAPHPPAGASVSERASSSMNLLRFGRGNGATPWILEPHIDGYWTPWHTAQSELDMAVESSTQLERALEQALTQQRALSSPRQEGYSTAASTQGLWGLVQRWREKAKHHEIKGDRADQPADTSKWHKGMDEGVSDCADELESLLTSPTTGADGEGDRG
jgi:hypothetical protein